MFTKSVSSILPNLNDNHVDLRPLLSDVPGVVFNGKVILLKSNGIHVTNIHLKDDTSSVHVMRANDKNLLLQCSYKNEVIHYIIKIYVAVLNECKFFRILSSML